MALDSPWAIAIQQYADGDLSRRKGQEIDRREKAEIRRAQRQIRRELAGNQRVDSSEEVREVRSGSERQEYEKDEAPSLRQVSYRSLRALSRCRYRKLRRGRRLSLVGFEVRYRLIERDYGSLLASLRCCRPPRRQQRALVLVLGRKVQE